MYIRMCDSVREWHSARPNLLFTIIISFLISFLFINMPIGSQEHDIYWWNMVVTMMGLITIGWIILALLRHFLFCL